MELVEKVEDQENSLLKDVKLIELLETDGVQFFPVEKLKYFVAPKPESYPLQLYANFQAHIFRNSKKSSGLNITLHFLLSERGRQLYTKSNAVNTRQQIFSKRGVFKFIMKFALPLNAPHNLMQTVLVATKFNGNLYLSTNKFQGRKVRGLPRHILRHKLEQYCFATSPGGVPNTDKPVDEHCQIFGMFSAKLKQFDLCYSGIINGIECEAPIGDLNDPAELAKCQPVIIVLSETYHKRTDFFDANLLIQTRFGCIKNIYTAKTNIDGVVARTLQRSTPDDLAKQRFRSYNCLDFLHNILEQIELLMKHVDCAATTYVFAYDYKQKRWEHKVYEGQSEYSFLSEEYIEFMQQT